MIVIATTSSMAIELFARPTLIKKSSLNIKAYQLITNSTAMALLSSIALIVASRFPY
jgi:hypothetical protein